MIPTFTDFTDKFGFNDGNALEPRDWLMRDKVIGKLQELVDADNILVKPLDGQGSHNACFIVFGDSDNYASHIDPRQIVLSYGEDVLHELIEAVYVE